MVGILVLSYALLLPLPIVCLSSLTMHCWHFIPATSALLQHSLHSTVLPVPCLPLFFGMSAVPVQRSDTNLEHVNCYFPGAILPKTCWQCSKFSLLPFAKAETSFLSPHFSLMIFKAVSWYCQQHFLTFWNETDAVFKYWSSITEMPSSWDEIPQTSPLSFLNAVLFQLLPSLCIFTDLL